MPNDPNYDRNDPNAYRKEKSGSGWAIAGVIAVVVIAIAMYQNHIHNANNLQNVEPAAGSVTNTYTTPDNTNTMGNTPAPNPATNTTAP